MFSASTYAILASVPSAPAGLLPLSQTEPVYDAAAALKPTPTANTQRLVESHVVVKVAVAVALAKPELDLAWLEKLEFVKKMYHSGEINFSEFIRKMQNLFPVHMNGLSIELRRQVEEVFAVH